MFPKNHRFSKQTPDKAGRKPAQQLYEPSIYTYTCRGSYHVSSTRAQTDADREGRCQGFRSQLELLSDMEVTTRKGALEDFTFWASGGDLSDLAADGDDEGSSELDPLTRSAAVSPALIFPEQQSLSKSRSEASKAANNTGDEETSSKEDQATKEYETNAVVVAAADSMLPEEELIQSQEWSCYGSTQVDYLLLRNVNSGEEKIAAVAPRNNGLSVRTVQASPGHAITCFGLGWLRVVIDSATSIVEEPEEQPAPVPKPEEPLPEEVPPRPSISTLAAAQQSVRESINFGAKVGRFMMANVEWLGHTLSDDFPARTYASGQRIVQQMPHTVERTGRFMGVLVQKMMGLNDDDRKNGGGGSPQK